MDTPTGSRSPLPADGFMPSDESWILSIDFGTTSSVVVARIGHRPPDLIEIDGERRIPSMVLVTEAGDLVVGRVADDLSASNPDRALRAPKSHVGEPHPVVLGGQSYDVTTLVAAYLRALAAAATEQVGRPPSEVRLTHPAPWSGPRKDQLRRASVQAGLGEPVLVAEPVAAAVAYAESAEVPEEGYVAVYDLGGGTFDTTVVRAAGRRRFVIVGRPTGDGQLGGELFDELLLGAVIRRLDPSVGEQLFVSDDPMWLEARARLRLEVRRAKEALSAHPYSDVVVALPAGLERLRVTRGELEELLRPYLVETVEILQRAVTEAGLQPDRLSAIHLVGGASRIPLVGRLVEDAFPGVAISRRGDPKTAVAIGAAIAARAQVGTVADATPPAPGFQPQGETVLDSVVAGGGGGQSNGTVLESQVASGGSGPAVVAPRSPGGRPRWLVPAAIGAAVAVIIAVVLGVTLGGGGSASKGTATTLIAGGDGGGGGSGPGPVPSLVTTPATTIAPTTVVATTVAPAMATQSELDSAVLSSSDLGGDTSPDTQATLCGNYQRPVLYSRAAYFVVRSGQSLGVVANLVGAYPDAAQAGATIAPIVSSTASCNPAPQPYTITPLAGAQSLCDQSYEGKSTPFALNGIDYNTYVGVIRCGSTIDAVDAVVRTTTASDQFFTLLMLKASGKLTTAVG